LASSNVGYLTLALTLHDSIAAGARGRTLRTRTDRGALPHVPPSTRHEVCILFTVELPHYLVCRTLSIQTTPELLLMQVNRQVYLDGAVRKLGPTNVICSNLGSLHHPDAPVEVPQVLDLSPFLARGPAPAPALSEDDCADLDPTALALLVRQGVPRARCIKALRSTGGDAESAMTWLFEHPDDAVPDTSLCLGTVVAFIGVTMHSRGSRECC